jgi:uncharacterized protein
MTTLTCAVPTISASRYLQQLCKHWSHKFEVKFDPKQGHVALPFGPLDLTATDDALLISAALNEGGDPERAKMVIADHLNRFAFREGELVFDWQVA